jgi:hypothetical protein
MNLERFHHSLHGQQSSNTSLVAVLYATILGPCFDRIIIVISGTFFMSHASYPGSFWLSGISNLDEPLHMYFTLGFTTLIPTLRFSRLHLATQDSLGAPHDAFSIPLSHLGQSLGRK